MDTARVGKHGGRHTLTRVGRTRVGECVHGTPTWPWSPAWLRQRGVSTAPTAHICDVSYARSMSNHGMTIHAMSTQCLGAVHKLCVHDDHSV